MQLTITTLKLLCTVTFLIKLLILSHKKLYKISDQYVSTILDSLHEVLSLNLIAINVPGKKLTALSIQ